PFTIVDVGAGTGFVGGALASSFSQQDRYIAVDPSSRMLEHLVGSLHGSVTTIETHIGYADRIPLEDSTADIVVMNSVLHHVPDVDAAIREAKRILKPGGVLAVMHDPNIRFARSILSRSVARIVSRLASHIDARAKSASIVPDYARVFDVVNARLLEEGLISGPLSRAEIQSIVDVHSPTARGTIDECGIDPASWFFGILQEFEVLEFKTYHHLGKLDPDAFGWRRAIEQLLSFMRPGHGSLFSFIARKRTSFRILTLCESMDDSSGWGTYAKLLTDAIRQQGHEVVSLTSDGTTQGPLLPSVYAPHWKWIMCRIRLYVWMSVHRFDAIHVMAEPYAKLFASFHRTPFVITVHGTYAEPAAHGPAWAVASFHEALRRACCVVCVSNFTAERLPSDVTHVRVIANGIDPHLVTVHHEVIDNIGYPQVLAVGAIKKRKGFDRLINAMKELRNTYPEAHLDIVGEFQDAEYAKMLRRQVVTLELEGVVAFDGRVSKERLLGFYKACDVFALTPVEDGGFEGFGLVYLEANAFGKPCVGTRSSGAAEAILDGLSGYLINPDDPIDVADGIKKALALPAQPIREYSIRASWPERIVEYLDVYRRCVVRVRSERTEGATDLG
ncbi:glycosyltransferase, partial [Candidatus Uhrbacteria bacterium]|nr:glycosyltransferase [Candidatus Uhrbacteria bacterium]